eukprot:4306953-Pyramimonas_sp.AAC.2
MAVLNVAYLARLTKDGKEKPAPPHLDTLKQHYPKLRELALAPGGRSGRTGQFMVGGLFWSFGMKYSHTICA